MKTIYNICNKNITNSLYSLYEGVLSDIKDTLDDADKSVDNLCKLHWGYAYLSNLPNRNASAIIGGMRGIYKKYFIKSVPKLETDRHSILPELFKHPERKHILNKLDVDGDYIASYMLQCEFDKPTDMYDFVNNEKDKRYLEETITSHMHKILNDEGKRCLKFKVKRMFKGGTHGGIISIAMETIYGSDFKLNASRYCDDIMCFNFTNGQYYYN